jgi:hypothetical protein
MRKIKGADMKKQEYLPAMAEEAIISKIYQIRGAESYDR